MPKVMFLFVVLPFFFAAYAEEVRPDLNKVIISTIEMMPTQLLDAPGDWYEIQYGQKANLLQRETVTVLKVEKPEDPKFMVVGFHELFDGPDIRKHKLVSYVGDERSIKEIGTEEVDSVDLLSPHDFAAKFGWKKE